MIKELQIKPLNDWGFSNDKKPLIISGPCSAETEEQVLETAHKLNNQGQSIFRAGIWKPRTRPNTFEGVGSVGLEWLKTVKKETGMLISIEVANIKHVYEALRAGIDILWIGARTTANPFAVQEIADSLKGLDIPIFVKNPVNPDVDLWIGAIERLNKSGLTKIGAIHRGFSSFEKSVYRNVPQWQIPIDLKRRIPDLPIICDPSHISGNSSLIHEISQKALDLDFEGLMIETHPDPDKAWSDAKQQITPEELKILIDKLIIRVVNPNGISLDTLENLRYKIDNCDNDLIEVLKQRMELVNSIGQYKKENNMTILQPNRWDEVLTECIVKGEKHDLDSVFIAKLFKTIHQESINKQTVIMNE